MLLVSEIFSSIEGEGIRAGYPATFIRLFGCNLRCTYCDSMYACEGTEFIKMTIPEIMSIVRSMGNKRITLTGGEPLIHKNVKELILALIADDCEVNIETNGAVDIAPYVDMADVIITMDFKCTDSGMREKMIHNNLFHLRTKDVLKFVVGSRQDLLDMLSVVSAFKSLTAQVFVSPVFGKIEPVEIVNFIKEHKLQGVRLQLQLHKFIWEPQKRGV